LTSLKARNAGRLDGFMLKLALGTAISVVLIGMLIGTRLVDRHLIVMSVVFIGATYMMGNLAKSAHEKWLPHLMALGMVAKLIGAGLRFFVLEVVYNGNGDAGGYHRMGLDVAEVWRTFTDPGMDVVGFGSQGTRFVTWFTGLLYTPYTPSMLGGFWVYSFLAFTGQFFLYLAFRRFAPEYRWKRYAILIFFWPTLVYWPSSIGKEALLLLFLGIGAWAAARLYQRYAIRWLPLIAGSIFMISLVRIHLAAVFAAGLLAPILLEKWSARPKIAGSRLLVLGLGVILAVPLAIGLADRFGVSLESVGTEDLDPVFASVNDATSGGGSAVSGGVIKTPLDIPAGTLKVLFRPLPVEARNAQMLISSLEGVALLGLVLWQAPKMWRNRSLLRRSPYLLFCLSYSALFVWAWSAMSNLGILARQRSLVIPFVLALVAGLGWREEPDPMDTEETLRPPATGRDAPIGLAAR
jgi:hypothetical protein